MEIVLWILIWAIGWCILHVILIGFEDGAPSSWDDDTKAKHIFLPCFSWAMIAIIALVLIIGGVCWCIWWVWTQLVGHKWQDLESWIWNKFQSKSYMKNPKDREKS